MKYLVDANVLSEATRPSPLPKVVDWLRQNEHELVMDAIILGEIRFGILLLPYGTKRHQLKRWFSEGVQRVHCLSWEAEIGLRWAQLLASLKTDGKAMPIKDSMIAATALFHNLTIATRNRRHFEEAGVKVVNPFD